MNARTLGLAVVLALGFCTFSRAAVVYDQDQNNTFTQNRQRSDHTNATDNVIADDFTLGQAASINQVNVRGKFSVDAGAGIDVVNSVIVNFYSNDGSTEGAPSTGSPLYTATIPGSFIPATLQGSEAPDYSLQIPLGTPFAASAATKYWVSVQAVTNNGGSSWQWDWNNDNAHPSNYSPNGSGTAQLSGGSWNQNWGRWWHSDFFNGDSWNTHSFTGAFSTTNSGDVDGQRMDLNFQLLGEFAAVPEPGTFGLAAMATAGLASIARRRRARKS